MPYLAGGTIAYPGTEAQNLFSLAVNPVEHYRVEWGKHTALQDGDEEGEWIDRERFLIVVRRQNEVLKSDDFGNL